MFSWFIITQFKTLLKQKAFLERVHILSLLVKLDDILLQFKAKKALCKRFVKFSAVPTDFLPNTFRLISFQVSSLLCRHG